MLEREIQMAGLKDILGQWVYDEVVGKKDRNLEEFTLLNAWKFFIDCCMEYPKAELCGIVIEKKGDHFEITQCLIQKNGECYRAKGDFVVGRKISAYSLDDDLLAFMDGENNRIMTLETLKNHK